MANNGKSHTKKKVSRSSKTGEFVTKKFAKKHPATTTTETTQGWEHGKVIKCAPDKSE